MSSTWTDAQKDAIETLGKSVLVSAAAGSGKTSVLAERCSHLVLTDRNCSISDLLVLTFAEEAAAEMKGRIEKTLEDRYQQAVAAHEKNRDHLKKQSILASTAHISTIHSFCARLIRQNFHLAELDPAFRVLDGAEATLLRREVADELLEEALTDTPEDGGGQAVRALLDLYGNGQIDALAGWIIQASERLRGIPDSESQRTDAVQWLQATATAGKLAGTPLGEAYLDLVRRELEIARAEAASILSAASEHDAKGPHAKVAAELVSRADECLSLLASDFDKVPLRLAERLPQLRGVGQVPEDVAELLKQRIDKLKKRFTASGSAVRVLVETPQQRLLDDLARIIPHLETFLRLIGDFDSRYEAQKREQNALDFSDLEHVALKLLRTPAAGGHVPSDLARRLHQRYRYVLVDEYQDINPVQEEILRYVSHECVTSEGSIGNLFSVGDVKQSIYRFRLAAPDIFMARRESYEKDRAGAAIYLRENFRSRGPLLEAINGVFRRLMKREVAEIEYDDTHAFVPGAKYPDEPNTFAGVPIRLQVLLKDAAETAEEEAEDEGDEETADLEVSELEARHVAGLVRDLLAGDAGGAGRRRVYDKSMKAYREIRPGDIVVLLRSTRQRAREYAAAFAEAGIPFRTESRSGFFNAPEVQEVLALLRLLDNGQQDIPLAAVLRSGVIGLANPEDAMARIAMAYRRDRVPFHVAVSAYATEKADDLAREIKTLLDRLDRWRQLSLQRSTEELISILYRETSLPAWYAALPNGDQRLANLDYLRQCAASFAGFSRQGLYRFMAYLADLEEDDSLAQPAAATEGEAVRLMTVHASKGLEYPVVILAGLATKFNLRDREASLLFHREPGSALRVGLRVADEPSNTRYPCIATHVIADQITRASLAEELRVLYVAMTRAREELILVGSLKSKELEQLMQGGLASGEALPSHRFWTGKCFLDWLIPIFNSETSKQLVVEPIVPSAASDSGKTESAEPVTAKVTLPYLPATQAVLDRLNYQYPHQAATLQPAAISVTTLAKGSAAVEKDEDWDRPPEPPASSASDPLASLAAPAFAREPAANPVGDQAALRGTVTHRVMEYFDFAQSADSLEIQIEAMVQRRLLTPEEAELVDREGIRWFFDTDLGQQLFAHAKAVFREVPFFDAVAGAGTGEEVAGLDRVMLRGRIDAILQTAQGLHVLDYKTDARLPEPGGERETGYRRQLEAYRTALAASGPTPILGLHLIFLHARRIVSL